MSGCSEPYHKFRFVGRMERDWPGGDGPKKGWLMWRSEDHYPSAEGIVTHAFAIPPELFWVSRFAADGKSEL